MTVPGSETEQRRITVLLAAAFVVSIVHYVDNVVSYADYPLSPTLPNPSAGLIAVAWFVLTGFGVAGYVALRRGARLPAGLLLMAYSLSGLVGIGHYLVPGVSAFPWWRHAHVLVDIALGVLVLGAAVGLLGDPARRPVSRAAPPAR